jgi:hypothetical protein
MRSLTVLTVILGFLVSASAQFAPSFDLLRNAAVIALWAGAAGSVGLMLYAGHRVGAPSPPAGTVRDVGGFAVRDARSGLRGVEALVGSHASDALWRDAGSRRGFFSHLRSCGVWRCQAEDGCIRHRCSGVMAAHRDPRCDSSVPLAVRERVSVSCRL